METVKKIVDFLSSSQFGVWGWPMIILILGTGIFITIRLKFLQVRKFGHMMNTTIVPTVKSIGKKKEKDTVNSISQFEAFSAAISGTIGTGNIIGVTSAILTGGPGAVFWMWVSAFFGMLTNYAENVLGLFYRKKDKNGDFSGGPAYYLSEGAKIKWLAFLAAIFCVIAAIGMSAVQTNKITDAISSATGNSDTWVKLLIGGGVALLIALIILGGIKRIGKVASVLVPFMTLLFFGMAIIIVFVNATALPAAFASIFKYAFNFKSAGGGILGYSIATIIQKGMARGVFSNEAGLGSSVIAHSASETREPVKQGLWGVFEVFLDTFIVCTLTALIVLTSFDLTELGGLIGKDTAVAMGSFSRTFGTTGKVLFSIMLPVFAFTTILAWSYYGEKSIEFIFNKFGKTGKKIAVIVFKIIYIGLIVFSAILTSEVVWGIADISNALMAIPNLVGLIFLSGMVVKITKNYFARKRGEKVEPMLSAYPDINEEFKRDIEKENGENLNQEKTQE